MLVRRRTPFREVLELQRDLMNLVGWSFDAAVVKAVDFLANTEAYLQDGQLVVRAELAGVDPKSVEVTVAGRTLTIKGERKAPEIPVDDRLFGEIAYGKFERTIEVPEGLKADQAKAVWHNGILEVRIPLGQGAKPEKVPVEITKA